MAKSLTERIRALDIRITSPTYRLLKGEITEAEYRRLLDERRKHYGLKPIGPDRG